MFDRIKTAGQWLVWRPIRLFSIILMIVVIWVVVVQLTSSPNEPSGSHPVATPTSGLPPGWESWPTTAVERDR